MLDIDNLTYSSYMLEPDYVIMSDVLKELRLLSEQSHILCVHVLPFDNL
jgi:hypothetical protein